MKHPSPGARSLARRFLETADRYPKRHALLLGETRVTYSDIASQTRAVSHLLRSRFHVTPGARVGILLHNQPGFIPALFGILHAGAVAVPINTFLKPDELAHLILDAGIQCILTETELEETLTRVCEHGVTLEWWNVGELEHIHEPSDDSVTSAPTRDEGDLAVLIYTSGTTGKPKGAMLTHGNLLHNVESCREILDVVEFDRFVLMLPMFHSFMLTVCILLPLLTGGSIVLIRSLHPAKAMIAEIIANEGSVLPAMAQVFRALAALPAEIHVPLRLCLCGAGPLPAEILRVFNLRFPDIPLIEGYGLSEASPVVSVNPIHGSSLPGTIGFPIPGVEISIHDDDGKPLPDLVDGEICVRGGNVMLGYWNAPEQSREALRDGWLLTGDVGHRRPDGYYVITDRKKDMLKPNGMNVYPREIEEVIHTFPGVREVAVVGEPDERRGERPVAFVVPDEGVVLDDQTLLAFLRERLADYKLPRRAIQLPALPKNATGKILKMRLREMLASGSA